MRSKPSSFETLCDILYLLIMIALSVNLLLKDGFGNPESRTYHLAGFMVVILILGDSFRFIPRITSFFIKDSDNVELVQDKGKIISLSATPSVQDLKDNHVFTLFKRYHNYPLPMPKIIIQPQKPKEQREDFLPHPNQLNDFYLKQNINKF